MFEHSYQNALMTFPLQIGLACLDDTHSVKTMLTAQHERVRVGTDLADQFFAIQNCFQPIFVIFKVDTFVF